MYHTFNMQKQTNIGSECGCSIMKTHIHSDNVVTLCCSSDLQISGHWAISMKTEIASAQDEAAGGIFADWEL